MEGNLDKIREMLASGDPDARRQGIIFAARFSATSLIQKLTEIAGVDQDQELRILARKALEKLKSVSQPTDVPVDQFAQIHFEQLLQSEDPYARFAGLKKALQENSEVGRLCIQAALEKESVVQLKASMIMAVSRFGRPDDVDFLSQFLRDSDSRVRANTIEALAGIGGDAANRYIIAMMADEDNRVKANVVKALKGIGGPILLDLLRKMSQDERAWMRASAVFAFSRIKSPQSLVLLAQIASADPEMEVREKAIVAIKAERDEGNPAAIVILEKIASMVHEERHDVADEIGAHLSTDEQEGIYKLLESADACKRYLAIAEIGEEYDGHQDVLIEAFQKEDDPFLLSMMLTIIKEKQPASSINRCIQLLKHEDDRVRANAVEAAAAVDIVGSADYLYPLLGDKNSRVAANSIIALGSIGRIDIFQEIKKMLNKGREAFRQSALYVIALQRERQYIPLLNKLLKDPNPKVRDKSFEILRSYGNERVTGSLKAIQEVELRISLEKSREHFFENSLDHLFSSLVQIIKADKGEDKIADEFVFEKTPEAEKHALLQLAEKCLENNLADERTVLMLEKIDEELVTVEKLIAATDESSSSKVPIEEEARKMSEIQLLKIETKSLRARKEAMLTALALDTYGSRKTLEVRTQALLRVELARVEGSLCSYVPVGSFSMLPADDSSVSEIFDVAMRLYQKHVWSFSGVTALQMFKWFMGMLLFAFFFGFFKALSPVIAGVYSILILPYFAYKSLGLFVEWKTMVACMVDDFIHGRQGTRAIWDAKVAELYPHVFSSSLRKYFFLLAWSVVAMFLGGVLVLGSEAFANIAFVSSIGKLLGVLMFLFVVASVFFKYMLIEPISVLAPEADPFRVADEIYNRSKVKMVTLVVFATFIMTIVTGTSLEILTFLMPVLPGQLASILIKVLAVVSEVCLFPIVYSSLVIYSLMAFRLEGKIVEK